MSNFKKISFLHPYIALMWLVMVLAMTAYNFRSLVFEKNIQVDLFALLPRGQNESLKQTQQFMEDSRLTSRVLILVGHKDKFVSQKALDALRQNMHQSNLPLVENIFSETFDQYKNLFKDLYRYRAGFLSTDDKKKILSKDWSFFTNRTLEQVYSSISLLGSVNIQEDPFFLFPVFVQGLIPVTEFEQDSNRDIYINSQGTYWYIFHGELSDASFSIDMQKEISQKLCTTLDCIKNTEGINILKTGAVFYAAAGFEQANQEISLISFFSVFGILGLFVLFFRSLKPLLLALIVISAGLSAGLFSCFMVFSTVHLVALLFGCSLVGITVDYVVHYHCAACALPNDKFSDRFIVLKILMPAILLGVLSSALGYAVLAIVPFPGIQQMAILASAGILCAFLSLFLWAPYVVKTSTKLPVPLLQSVSNVLVKIATFRKNKNLWLLFNGFIFCFAVFNISTNDDLRSFQSLNEELKQEEDTIKEIVKFSQPSHFLVVKADSLENLLQLEEKILNDLGKLNVVEKALCQLITSKQQQVLNRKNLNYLYKAQLANLQNSLGIDKHQNDTKLGLNENLFELSNDKIKMLPDGWRQLIRFEEDGTVTGRILLTNDLKLEDKKFIKEEILDATYVNPMGEYQSLFKFYREKTITISFVCIVVIFSVLAFMSNATSAFKIMFPIVLSLFSTVSIISILKIQFTLFHPMGALLVLCIGIDYSLFLFWRKPEKTTGPKIDILLIANTLCALTTLLSFGFLAFSQTKAIHDFGLFVFIGIILCFFNTAFFIGKKE